MKVTINNFAANLKFLRKELLGLERKKLSEKIDVHPQTITSWEAGKNTPPDGKMQDLCNILSQFFPEFLLTPATFVTENFRAIYQNLPKTNSGMKEFLNDEQIQIEMNPNKDEIYMLKAIRFPSILEPSKEFYIHALLDLRKSMRK